MTDHSAYYDKGLGGGRNTLDARFFWEEAQHRRFVVQRCAACAEHVFPPQDVCPYCWNDGLEWTAIDGDGTVYSFSTIHVDLHAAWTERVPYTVAFVRLSEGVFVLTTLVECEPSAVEVGMAVEVVFRPVPDEDGLFPQFRPIRD